MNDPQPIPYERKIFVCTHDLKGEKPSCGDQNGPEIFRRLREIARKRGLHPRIRVAQATCLGQCGKGCNIMIFPDQVWIHGVSVDDVDCLANKYLNEEKKDESV